MESNKDKQSQNLLEAGEISAPELLETGDTPLPSETPETNRTALPEVADTPSLIEMPESIRTSLLIPVREVGAAATSVVVSRPLSEGRFGIPPIPIERPEGIVVEKPGYDSYTRQARTAVTVGSSPERPTAIDTEEV